MQECSSRLSISQCSDSLEPVTYLLQLLRLLGHRVDGDRSGEDLRGRRLLGHRVDGDRSGEDLRGRRLQWLVVAAPAHNWKY
jgi:hypothetical protein